MTARGRARLAALGVALLVLGLTAPPATAAPAAPAARAVTVSLTASASRAPVGTEVPITVTVTPASVADVSSPRGRIVRVQVRDQAGLWQTIDSYRLPRSGVLRASVTGIVPGYTGMYRAVVVRLHSPRALAVSNAVGIFWLNADGTEPPSVETTATVAGDPS